MFDPGTQSAAVQARPQGQASGALKSAALTAARHVSLCSANRIKPPSDLSDTHARQRGGLLDAVHGRNADPFDRSIDTLVSRLRKKIEVASDQDRLIATIRNHGYLFTPMVQIVSQ